jgi:hypothetical protein
MGVHIDDLANKQRSIRANWWQWRPTVEILRSFGLFDTERLDTLSNGIGQFSPDELQAIVCKLEMYVATQLRSGTHVLLDGTVTTAPDRGTFYRDPEEQHLNYSADYDWLIEFIAFCKQSSGIYVC